MCPVLYIDRLMNYSILYCTILGSYQDCVNHLMSFGIPKEAIPINLETGELEVQSHLQWMETVKAKEQYTRDAGPKSVTPVNEIVILGLMDIIVGRGNKSRSSVGYLRMCGLIQDHRDEYENSDRNEKTRLSQTIVKKALQAGCRFIRWTPQGLVECDELQSRDKIAHAFRNMRRTENYGRGKAPKRVFNGDV
jgi:hypothetical protein